MSEYWFRKRKGLASKDLGWGWIPVSWEGWIIVIVATSLIAVSGYMLGIFEKSVTLTHGFLYLFSILVILILSALLAKSKTRP